MAGSDISGDTGNQHLTSEEVVRQATQPHYLKHSPKSAALVCMGPSVVDYLTATLTQEFKVDWVDEVWAINMACNSFRSDVVFWLDDLVDQHAFRPPLMEALNTYKIPVITSKAHRDIVPLSYDYPIDDIAPMAVELMGKPYLNNGVAMAIAYALHIGLERLHIFGADFSYPDRDFAESGRGCTETWVTIAGMKGMSVILSGSTSLMDGVKDHGVYGYKVQPDIRLKDGTVRKYVKDANQRFGKYVPEDSSSAAAAEKGASDVDRHEPAGLPGAGHPAGGAAGGADYALEAACVAKATVAEPGRGLRDSAGLLGGEIGALALHDSGGAGRQVPRETEIPLLYAAGLHGPGPAPAAA